MSDQTLTQEAEPKGGISKIAPVVLKWAILGLLLFTCVMAAIRKFGG
jgi:hypothetical protein